MYLQGIFKYNRSNQEENQRVGTRTLHPRTHLQQRLHSGQSQANSFGEIKRVEGAGGRHDARVLAEASSVTKRVQTHILLLQKVVPVGREICFAVV